MPRTIPTKKTRDRFDLLAETIYVKVKASRKTRGQDVIAEVAEKIREVVADYASVLARDSAAAFVEKQEKVLHELKAKHVDLFDKLLRTTEQLADARAQVIGVIEQGAWPWCEACNSYHHPSNPTCVFIDKK
jgi:hypothetical protein